MVSQRNFSDHIQGLFSVETGPWMDAIEKHTHDKWLPGSSSLRWFIFLPVAYIVTKMHFPWSRLISFSLMSLHFQFWRWISHLCNQRTFNLSFHHEDNGITGWVMSERDSWDGRCWSRWVEWKQGRREEIKENVIKEGIWQKRKGGDSKKGT